LALWKKGILKHQLIILFPNEYSLFHVYPRWHRNVS